VNTQVVAGVPHKEARRIKRHTKIRSKLSGTAVGGCTSSRIQLPHSFAAPGLISTVACKVKNRFQSLLSQTQLVCRYASERPRISVYRSNQHTYVQVIDDDNQTTLCAIGTMSPKIKAGSLRLPGALPPVPVDHLSHGTQQYWGGGAIGLSIYSC
jgi:ribosomal protein L18